MKFDSFTVRKVCIPLEEPFEISSGTVRNRNLVVLEAEEGGRKFYGEASPQFAPLYNHETAETAYHVVKEFVVPALRKSSSIQDYHQRISRFKGNPLAFSAGDFLLHHRKSLEQDKSLRELVEGGREFSKLGASVGIHEKPENLVESVGELAEQGYERVKLKIKPGKDLEYVSKVRERFPELEVTADANASYSLEQLERLRKLDGYDLKMIEQPLGVGDLHRHAELAGEIETLICLDESIRSREDLVKADELGAVDFLNLKPQRVRGLYPAKRIAEEAEKRGIDLWVGSVVESGIGNSMALAMTSRTSEGLKNDVAPSSRYFEQDLLEDPIEAEDGKIRIPDAPGLYSRVSEDRLEKFTVRKTTVSGSEIKETEAEI
ncbi:MAG: o-succinylbenzoate synthase [Candidatus Nanosalina sp.]